MKETNHRTEVVGLLCPRRQRPRRRAAEQRDELASLHYSTTSSARTRIDGERLRPSDLAVFVFTTSSNFVGCSMGKSAGFAPFRSFATRPPACRHIDASPGP